jgi:hypothetical protein
LSEDSSNQILFDLPGIFHVGQPEWPEGNCYQHHIKIGERPCTSLKEVEQNERIREQKWKEIGKQRKEIKKLTKKEQDRLDRWDREQENFEKWQLKLGFH